METIKISSGAQLPKNFTGIVEYPNNIEVWYKNGSIHRKDGPAYINKNLFGYQLRLNCWYKNGKLHRIDGPAVEHWNGSKHWYINGKHPINGPAKLIQNISYWYFEKRYYPIDNLIFLFEKGIFLGEEKRKHGISCLKFLTVKNGIEEFPIMNGMEQEIYKIYNFDLVSKLKEYK